MALLHRKAAVTVYINVGVNNTLKMRKTNFPVTSPKLDVLPLWGSSLIAV